MSNRQETNRKLVFFNFIINKVFKKTKKREHLCHIKQNREPKTSIRVCVEQCFGYSRTKLCIYLRLLYNVNIGLLCFVKINRRCFKRIRKRCNVFRQMLFGGL